MGNFAAFEVNNLWSGGDNAHNDVTLVSLNVTLIFQFYTTMDGARCRVVLTVELKCARDVNGGGRNIKKVEIYFSYRIMNLEVCLGRKRS